MDPDVSVWLHLSPATNHFSFGLFSGGRRSLGDLKNPAGLLQVGSRFDLI